MGTRAQAVQAVLAFFIGDGIGTVFQVEAHAGNARLACILDTVLAAVGKHLADQVGLLREHAANDLNASAGAVGLHAAADRLRRVHPIAGLAASANTQAVAQDWLCAHGNIAQSKLQIRASSAQRISKRCAIEPGRALHISETSWQAVVDHRARQRHGGDVVELDRIIDKVTNFRRGLVGRFLNEQLTGRTRINRHIEIHQLSSCSIDGEDIAI